MRARSAWGDRPAVRLGREDPDIGRDEGEPVGAQVELADDRRAKPADRLGDARRGRRGDLDGVGDPADALAAVEDEGAQAGSSRGRPRPRGRCRPAPTTMASYVAVRVVGGVVGGWRPGVVLVPIVRPPSGCRGREDLQRGDPPVGAHDPAARMGRRAAQPEIRSGV